MPPASAWVGLLCLGWLVRDLLGSCVHLLLSLPRVERSRAELRRLLEESAA